MEDHHSTPYVFVSSSDDQSTRCGYNIICDGHLERIRVPFTQKDSDGTVELSSADIAGLIKTPVTQEGLLDRCDGLYKLRSRSPAVSEERPDAARTQELGALTRALARRLGINGK